MTAHLRALEKHLGIRLNEADLNHYSLLALEPNAKGEDIKHALRQAAARWNASDPKSNPESAQIVAKLLKQAQQVLLDSEKKHAYDLQLGSGATKKVKPVPIEAKELQAVGQSKVLSLFPNEDPYQPFAAEAWKRAASADPMARSYGSIAERWNALVHRIPAIAIPSTATPAMATSAMAPSSVAPSSVAPSSVAKQTTFEFGPAASNRSASKGSAAQAIERLRKKRKQSQQLTLAGIASLAVLLLGFSSYRFFISRQPITQKPTQILSNGQTISEPLPNSSSETLRGQNKPITLAPGRSSGLPTLSRNDSDSELAQSTVADESPIESNQPLAPMNMALPIPKPEMNPAASKSEWTTTMKKAKAAIEKADFPEFHEQIKNASALSTNDALSAKHARLDQLGQLYEIFVQSLREAKSKLRASESIPLGSSSLSVVEVTETELIVRVAGKNERYSLDRLPLGIAMALAKLSLSESEPIDVAARAVYCSLSPARNELFEKRAKELFEQSVGKGQVRKDLLQAFSDVYE